MRSTRWQALTLALVAAAFVFTVAAKAEPREVSKVKGSHIAAAIVGTWKCQDNLGAKRWPVQRNPWALKGHTYAYAAGFLNLWKLRLNECRAALKRERFEWNWQAFPRWIIDLAVCETGGSGRASPGEPNWWAEGSSSHGTFYSAFNISRQEYDRNAHLMGVRGWNEGAGVPSPYEQAMAVIGHVRRFGNNGFGSCSGIGRTSW